MLGYGLAHAELLQSLAAPVVTRIALKDLTPSLRKRLNLDGEIAPRGTKAKVQRAPSNLESRFEQHCRAYSLPPFEREYLFATHVKPMPRLWRFDFAWPQFMVAVECEGLVMRRVNGELLVTGRHVHPNGFRGDCIKYGTAMQLGWAYLRFEQELIGNGTAIDMTVDLLRAKGWKQS